MTREDFDKQMDMHYPQLVKMAQAQLSQRGVRDIQGEDIIDRMAIYLLEAPHRLEKMQGMGYFKTGIRRHISNHIRSQTRQERTGRALTVATRPDRKLTSRKQTDSWINLNQFGEYPGSR